MLTIHWQPYGREVTVTRGRCSLSLKTDGKVESELVDRIALSGQGLGLQDDLDTVAIRTLSRELTEQTGSITPATVKKHLGENWNIVQDPFRHRFKSSTQDLTFWGNGTISLITRFEDWEHRIGATRSPNGELLRETISETVTR